MTENQEEVYKREIEILKKRVQVLLDFIYDIEKKLLDINREMNKVRFLTHVKEKEENKNA